MDGCCTPLLMSAIGCCLLLGVCERQCLPSELALLPPAPASNGPIPILNGLFILVVLSLFFLQPLGAVAPPNENLRFLVLFFTVACSSLFYRTRWQIKKNTNDAEPYFSQFSIIIFYFTLIGVCTKVHKVGA